MTLSACSTSPSNPQIEYRTVFVTLPAALTQHFCEFKGSGDTVGTLTEGFVYNTVCGKKYQAQIEEQQEYIRNVTKEKEVEKPPETSEKKTKLAKENSGGSKNE